MIDWSQLKRLIAIGGIAVSLAVFVWLCWIYWPVIAPLAVRTAGALMGMISRMAGFLKAHFPEIVAMALAIIGVGVVSSKEIN